MLGQRPEFSPFLLFAATGACRWSLSVTAEVMPAVVAGDPRRTLRVRRGLKGLSCRQCHDAARRWNANEQPASAACCLDIAWSRLQLSCRDRNPHCPPGRTARSPCPRIRICSADACLLGARRSTRARPVNDWKRASVQAGQRFSMRGRARQRLAESTAPPAVRWRGLPDPSVAQWSGLKTRCRAQKRRVPAFCADADGDATEPEALLVADAPAATGSCGAWRGCFC